MADLGINVTNEITKGLKEKVKENKIKRNKRMQTASY